MDEQDMQSGIMSVVIGSFFLSGLCIFCLVIGGFLEIVSPLGASLFLVGASIWIGVGMLSLTRFRHHGRKVENTVDAAVVASTIVLTLFIATAVFMSPNRPEMNEKVTTLIQILNGFAENLGWVMAAVTGIVTLGYAIRAGTQYLMRTQEKEKQKNILDSIDHGQLQIEDVEEGVIPDDLGKVLRRR